VPIKPNSTILNRQFYRIFVARHFTVATLGFAMITLDHSPVQSDSRILGGTLVFKGTRVKAQTLLDYLAAGDALEDFLEDFPTVNRKDAELFLQLAREENHS
jgi:uncharacterized protein (DUF433 family)